MDVYYFVIAITFLICYFYKIDINCPRDYRRKIFWVFVPIFIYGALRVDFGIDYPNYESEFYYLNGHPENIDTQTIHSELGYQWLEVIMPNWRSLVILVSSLVALAYAFLYYKYVDSNMLFFVIFVTFLYPDQSFFLNFVAMRNGMVIALFCLSIPLLIRKKYLYVFAIAIGLFFIHKSAILFIPLAILAGQNFDISKEEIIVWTITILIFAAMSNSDIIENVSLVLRSEEFESYRDTYLRDSGHASWLYGLANAPLIFWTFKWAWRNRKDLLPSQNVIWRLAMLYMMCPYLGAIGRTRMNYYFFPFYVITLSYIAKDQWPSKLQKTAFICLAISIMIYQTFVLWMNNARFPYSHYHSILQGIWG